MKTFKVEGTPRDFDFVASLCLFVPYPRYLKYFSSPHFTALRVDYLSEDHYGCTSFSFFFFDQLYREKYRSPSAAER